MEGDDGDDCFVLILCGCCEVVIRKKLANGRAA